jgi:uncharacterized pyridoxamine 5'-phosphate oxidase family protein
MTFDDVKKFIEEVGWGFLGTTDGSEVGVRPMGSCFCMDNELWTATREGTDKVKQLRKNPNAEYCFSDQQGKHVRISGTCIISKDNDDKLKLYNGVPILKKYIQDPTEETYVVIRMKLNRIRLMTQAGGGYEKIELPK